jgi:thymidylate synthase (FAD)
LSTIDPQMLFQSLNGREDAGFATLHTPVYATPGGVPYLQAPGVVVLARPHTNIAGVAGFLAGFDPALNFSAYLDDPTPLPEGAQLAKIAGQLCYMSFGPKRSMNAQAKRYFDNLKSSGHGSVFEHATFSLLLYGISRSVTHELIRHRAGFGYSQLSQRFVSGRMLRFVERPEYRTDEQEARTDLRKKVQQAARSVLPNETEAPIVVTGNGRAWRHVIEERASAHAEVEIRELAVRIFLCLRQVDPVLFDDYTLEPLSDGTYTVKTEFEKV